LTSEQLKENHGDFQTKVLDNLFSLTVFGVGLEPVIEQFGRLFLEEFWHIFSEKIVIISLNSFRSIEAKKSEKGSRPCKAFEQGARETLFRSIGLISFFILEQKQRSATESAEVRGPVDWLLSDFVR